MATLYELAKLIRSKNAGPFNLTLDILFEDLDAYSRVVKSGKITSEVISRLFGIPANEVRIFEYEAGRAMKISFPRPVASGTPGDPDLTGGQQYAPLVMLEI